MRDGSKFGLVIKWECTEKTEIEIGKPNIVLKIFN
jgi:hypothetical protein